MINFFKSKFPEPIDKNSLLKILDKEINPILSEINLKWNGDSLWISDSKNGMRNVFKYQKSKGTSAIFIWGKSFDFIPIPLNNRIRYFRTEKSARLQLFRYSTTTDNFLNGKSDLENGVTTYFGKKETEKSIRKLINNRKNEIFRWFDKSSTLEGVLEIANKQMTDRIYNTQYPNPKYVSAFINAKLGNKDLGIKLLAEIQKERLKLDVEIYEKLKDKLIEL